VNCSVPAGATSHQQRFSIIISALNTNSILQKVYTRQNGYIMILLMF